MIKLTAAHIAALESEQHDLFVQDMVRFFQDHDPFHAEALGVSGLTTAIAVGIRFARDHGITERDPVRVYLQLMFYLGGRFAKDPLMPWAPKILDPSRKFHTQAERVANLREAALGHLRDTCGRDGAPLRNFMHACTDLKTGQAADMNRVSLATFVQNTYPLKARFLGEQALDHIIYDSAALCAKAKMTSTASVTYLALMRLVYGYWVTDDPLFPWVRKVFQAAQTSRNPDALFARQVGTFFDRVAAHIAEREAAHVR